MNIVNEDYLLSTHQLTKKYRREIAISSLSLQIRNKSIYGLLGPNGAGKTTTLKMLTGLLKPTSGSIIFNGHKWERNDLQHIGSLIEQAPLYGNLTARENLKVHTTLLGISDKRINEVLEIVDLMNTGKKRAGQFSLGMKQRLGIAIALLNNPKLLILDEPTNGLDPIGIQDLRKLISFLPDQGITVLLSSHMLAEVHHVADDIGIISNGVLGYQGAIDESKDLEALFMEIVAQNDKEVRAVK